MTLKRTVLVGCTYNIHQSVCGCLVLKESNLATVRRFRDIFLYSKIIFPYTFLYKKKKDKGESRNP